MKARKVFNFGLPRSGTTSFHHAMNILGYRSIHIVPNKFDFTSVQESGVFDRFDAFCDAPIYVLYREILEFFPDAFFVITTRDAESWLRSVKYMFARWRAEWGPPTHAFHRKYLFTDDYDEEKLLAAYAHHHTEVARVFSGKNILSLDLACPNKFELLSSFLDEALPECPYPHDNPADFLP